jgi:hypothetical protein
MSHLSRMLDLLPPPYTVEPDSVLSGLLEVVGLEMDVFQEDLQRYQQSHWVGTVYRLQDLEKIGALMGIARLPWEEFPVYRERLLALVVALRQGATGRRQLQQFAFDYLSNVERVLESIYLPGLRLCATIEDAYATPDGHPQLRGHPQFRPLELVENPHRECTSNTLRANNGKAPYLFRWEEQNGGLDDTTAEFIVTGMLPGTSVPILVNQDTGDLIGYKGRLRFGQTLEIRRKSADGADRAAVATLDGRDATKALFSAHGFQLGVPLAADKLDAAPRLPALVRGRNRWIFLAIGVYDVPGLNRFFFAMPDDELREGVFDETRFDHALFPSGTVAQLRMDWVETEPASFELRVPRYVVINSGETGPWHEEVADALRAAIARLHAAGVRAQVRFVPFVEKQPQQTRFWIAAKVLDPETGPAGERDVVTFGGRFGESGLGDSRFE